MSDAAPDRPGFCYRHPDRPSFVLCQRCGRTICGECQTPAPVGVICPECMREQRASAPRTKPAVLTRARAAADRGAPVVTYSLIGITGFVYLMQWLIPASVVTERVLLQPGLHDRDTVRAMAGDHVGVPALHDADIPCAAEHVHALDLRPVARGHARSHPIPVAVPHQRARRLGGCRGLRRPQRAGARSIGSDLRAHGRVRRHPATPGRKHDPALHPARDQPGDRIHPRCQHLVAGPPRRSHRRCRLSGSSTSRPEIDHGADCRSAC